MGDVCNFFLYILESTGSRLTISYYLFLGPRLDASFTVEKSTVETCKIDDVIERSQLLCISHTKYI